MKKDETEKIMRYALTQRTAFKIDKTKMHDIVITWTVTDNKTDPDNQYSSCKFLLDGIVKAGLLAGDGRRFIRNIHNKIETKDKPCITVDFIEI